MSQPRRSDLGSERQQTLMFHDEAVRQHEQILDIFSAVERLHDVSAESLRKSAAKAKSVGAPLVFSLSRGPSKPPFKVETERLTRALPSHLTACLLGRLPSTETAAALSGTVDLGAKSCEAHLTEGLRLLAALCDTAARTPALCHILQDGGFRAQVVDLALLVLVSMSGPDVDDALRLAASPTAEDAAAALLHAELVPGALQVLAAGAGPVAVTSEGGTVIHGAGGPFGHFEGLAVRILGLPASEHLLDAMFDGVRTLIRMVRAALDEPHSATDIYQLAYHAGVALEVLAELAATPLFYHRLLLHDPSAAAPLRLVLAALSLHDAPLAPPPFVRGPRDRLVPAKQPADITTVRARGATELLAARGATLLCMLAELEQPSLLDSVTEHAAARSAAREIVARLGRNTELVLRRPAAARVPTAPGEAQLALACLRATEMLADDSNHRAQLMDLLAGPAAAALSLPAPEFEASWCGGAAAVALHSGNVIALPIASITPLALSVVNAITAAAESLPTQASAALQGSPARPSTAVAAAVGAMERGLLLFKLLGNLHAPSDALPEDHFLGLLHGHLTSEATAAAAARNTAALAAWVHRVHEAARAREALQGGPPGTADLLATPEDLGLADDLAAKLQARTNCH